MNELEKHAMGLLTVDTLALANENVGLAIALQQGLSRDKEDAFSVLGDTHSQISYAEAIRCIERAGYSRVFNEQHGDDNESFDVWWGAGVLLTTESYTQKKVNKITAYYNWAPVGGDASLAYQIAESGGFIRDIERLVWAGQYDGRAGLHTHLKRLRENGEILPQWLEAPFLWLVNYTEEHAGRIQNDYPAINARKLATLPAEVQQAICFSQEHA